MVVGPPGTGKTDTAVQIMHVLYHNCPSQRTLLIAHSNQVCPKLPSSHLYFGYACAHACMSSGLRWHITENIGRTEVLLAVAIHFLLPAAQKRELLGIHQKVNRFVARCRAGAKEGLSP